MLEAVAGAAAGDHHVSHLGVPIDDEMLVGGVFELADARFGDRLPGKRGEALGEVGTGAADFGGADDALVHIGVEAVGARGGAHLEAAAIDAGEAVVALFRVVGKVREGEALIAGREPEVQHIASRHLNARCEQGGKEFGQPRSAGEHEAVGGQA